MKIFQKISFLLGLTFLILTFHASNSQGAKAGANVGNLAPEIEMTDLEGNLFKLSDFKDKKPVHLIFWATWCPTCKREIPQLKKLHAELGNQIEMVAINVDSLSFWGSLGNVNKKVKHYVNKNEIPYRIALDEGKKIIDRYQVRGTPTQILINKKGIIVKRFSVTGEKAAAIIKSLL